MSTQGRIVKQIDHFKYQYENDSHTRIENLFGQGKFMIWVNTAWAAMLIRQGIIPQKHASAIAQEALDCLKELHQESKGFDGFENWVIAKHGADVGGNLTIGRTIPPLQQMGQVRHHLLKRIPLFLDIMQTILDLSAQHLQTVMPGYTHLRHAQPTTFGHYLLSLFDPMLRAMNGIEEGYHLMNLNELGCGALSGTSLPIDRDLTSAYLGLDGLIENANDAVSYTDGYVTLTAALANLNIIFSRFSMDLNIWSSEEYGFLDVPWTRMMPEGEQGHTHSHFMPNKTNNCPLLERTRVGTAEVMGHLNAVCMMGMRCPHADMHEMLHMAEGVVAALKASDMYLHPYLYILPRTTIFPERMKASLAGSWIAATELGNVMVMTQNMSYRIAHDILNEYIHSCKQDGKGTDDASFALFCETAERVAGKTITMDESVFRNALDPEHFISVTNSKGGVAPTEAQRMLTERNNEMQKAYARQEERIRQLEDGYAMLEKDLEGMVVL